VALGCGHLCKLLVQHLCAREDQDAQLLLGHPAAARQWEGKQGARGRAERRWRMNAASCGCQLGGRGRRPSLKSRHALLPPPPRLLTGTPRPPTHLTSSSGMSRNAKPAFQVATVS
jgi:hypothetical protein